jgi:hypothetical protein
MALRKVFKAAGHYLAGNLFKVDREIQFDETTNPEIDSQGGSFIWKILSNTVVGWRLRDDIKGQDAFVIDTTNDKVTVPSPYTLEGEVAYDNTISGLTATDVKAAVDELKSNTDGLTSADISTPNDAVTTHLTSLEDVVNHSWSAADVDGFDITENGNGTVTITDGDVALRIADTQDAQLRGYRVTGGTTGTELPALVDNDQNFIYVDYNAGTPDIKVTTDPTIITGTTQTPIFLVTRIGNTTHYADIRKYTTDFPHLQTRREFFTEGYIHELGGSELSESGTRSLNLTAGAFYLTTSRIPHAAFDTNVADTFTRYSTSDSGATWTRTTGQTQVENTQWNDITTGLTTLVNNKFKVVWVFVILNNTDILAVLEGQAEYNSLAEAEVAKLPTVLPPELQAYSTGQLVAKVIIEKSAANFDEIQTPFDTPLVGGQPTIHNGLSGLQGGTVNEYNHLTNAELSDVQSLVQNNLSAVVGPTATDDSGSGYAINSVWVDTAADNVYLCVDATATAAVWKQLDASGGGSGDVVGPASATDLALALFDGTTGKLLKNSLGTMDATGQLVVLQALINHTAIADDEHAFEIFCDAAGFGDVKAIDIAYTTGAIAGGSDEAVILANIDESAATGGDVTALEILATEGLAQINGMLAGVNVNPVEQLSGTFGDMGSALVLAVNRLTEFTTAGNDISIFVNDNDTVTIGNAIKFEEIEFLLATVASQNIQPTFEYSTGVGTWASFSPVDGTNGMTNNGVIAWLDSDIPSWALGTGSEYLIRITRTRNALTTAPIESKVQIAEATEYKWDKDGNIDIKELKNNGVHTLNKGADLASAAALPVLRDGNYFDVTGTTTITSINTLGIGTIITLHFDAALTLTHNATDLVLPGGENITTAAGDEFTFIEYATGDWRCISYALASGLSIGGKEASINFVIDGGGATITTGIKYGAKVEVPFDCTITSYTALADQSGSITVDIWKDTYVNYPPTDADSITASAPVDITTATKSQDSTLTGWTTSLTKGDILLLNVDSAASIQVLSISLNVTKN